MVSAGGGRQYLLQPMTLKVMQYTLPSQYPRQDRYNIFCFQDLIWRCNVSAWHACSWAAASQE